MSSSIVKADQHLFVFCIRNVLHCTMIAYRKTRMRDCRSCNRDPAKVDAAG